MDGGKLGSKNAVLSGQSGFFTMFAAVAIAGAAQSDANASAPVEKFKHLNCMTMVSCFLARG
jgi:hypothetical protein